MDTYRWLPGGRFLAHDVDAEVAGERVQSLEVIGADPEGDGLTTRSFDPDGSINAFAAGLDGRSWRIGGAAQRFRGEVSQDGRTLSDRWEHGGEGAWRPLMDVTLRRRGG